MAVLVPTATKPNHIISVRPLPMATIPPTPCFGEFRKEKLMSNLALCDWWPGYLYTFYTSYSEQHWHGWHRRLYTHLFACRAPVTENQCFVALTTNWKAKKENHTINNQHKHRWRPTKRKKDNVPLKINSQAGHETTIQHGPK